MFLHLGYFLQKGVFLQKGFLSAEILSFCRNTTIFLQKAFSQDVSAETNLSAERPKAESLLQKYSSISAEREYFCRKAAFLPKHPFLQKVTEMQKYFGSISAPSETAETEMFLLSVDL